MKLTGLHLLLTYRCTYECDHCFVWGSPRQRGTFTLAGIRSVLDQAESLGSVEWIYFEGGEPFLYYALLNRGIEDAASRGFKVGIVSNAYWATSEEDAAEYLRPFVGRVSDLSISCDLYHGSDTEPAFVEHARNAAASLDIPCALIRVSAPGEVERPEGEAALMFKGRAAAVLASRVEGAPAETFDNCPYEELRNPERVHVDPLGHLHLCQGITIGNLFEESLVEICETYDPDRHPITGPLLRGGPSELARLHGISVPDPYADACHYCDTIRRQLRGKYPGVLAPDQVYGVEPSSS